MVGSRRDSHKNTLLEAVLVQRVWVTKTLYIIMVPSITALYADMDNITDNTVVPK